MLWSLFIGFQILSMASIFANEKKGIVIRDNFDKVET